MFHITNHQKKNLKLSYKVKFICNVRSVLLHFNCAFCTTHVLRLPSSPTNWVHWLQQRNWERHQVLAEVWRAWHEYKTSRQGIGYPSRVNNLLISCPLSKESMWHHWECKGTGTQLTKKWKIKEVEGEKKRQKRKGYG